MSKTIYHKHHIIPKHMGGTDDPSNLVRLTVEEHAQAHKELYEKYGYQQDLIAYKALKGTIGKEELSYELAKLGGQKGALKGGLAALDKKVGIHDPDKIYLKQKGGKEGAKHLQSFTKNSVWVNKDGKDTRIPKENLQEHLDRGWSKGRLFSANRGKPSQLKESIWINNGKINKRIPRDQLEKYSDWSPGMI